MEGEAGRAGPSVCKTAESFSNVSLAGIFFLLVGTKGMLVQSVTELGLFPALAMSFLAGFFALESPVKRDGFVTTLCHLVSPSLKTPAAHVRLYLMLTPPSLVG